MRLSSRPSRFFIETAGTFVLAMSPYKVLSAITAAALGAAVGMVLPGSAAAADLSRPAPEPYTKAPPPAPAFSWTGFYIGGNLGAAWGQGNVTDALTGLTFSGTSNAEFVGGGQFGFNYQVNSLVFGLEGDFDWAANNNNNGTGVVIPGSLGFGHTFTASLNDRWISTFTGRLGYAWDRVLLYGKGGAAWVGNNGFTVTDVTTGTSLTGTSSNSTTGWTAGVGLEWAFASNWTARVEYDYIGLGNRTFAIPATSRVLAGDTFTTNANVQMVTVGLNYLFNLGGY
jgi:outer membrane immunogenic protein